MPRLDTLLRIMEAGNTNIEWLATGRGSMNGNPLNLQTPSQKQDLDTTTIDNIKVLDDQLLDINATIDEVMNDIEEAFDQTAGLHEVLNIQTKTLKRELKKAETTLDKLIEETTKNLNS